MKQPSQISESIICNKIIFLMMIFLVLTILPSGFARENSNNFSFNGLNGISNKSSSMFYNDNNPAPGKPPASYNAAVGRKLSDGVEVTATSSQYPVKLIPITLTQGMGTRTGSRITYAVAPGVHIIYAFKGNGVKEDIVFDHPTAAPLDLAFRMGLDPMLEARLDSKGNVVIYGPNSILSGFIQTGDSKSAELILKARRHAPKDNLLYIIPAPVVIDGAGIKHKNIAYYSLEKSILTIHADGLANVPAPASIDPSIVVTSTADFMRGNNEGMISFDTDAISRAVPSGGSVGTWAATTSFTTARFGHTSVVYNGYLYVIGGWSGDYCNDVQYAPINADGTLGAWTATTSFTNARHSHTSAVYNGYLYVMGGWSNASLNDVQYAHINADGTLGAWTATTSFALPRYNHASVAYNGYLYVIGGYGTSSILNNVQYAPINADGSVGAWNNTSSFTTPRYGHTSVIYNGYLYVIGGWSGTNLNNVQYAPINPDGTVGIWMNTTSFTTGRFTHSSIVNNGYLYVIGGSDGTNNLNDVQYAPINTNGTVGSWIATASFTTPRYSHTSVAFNGYLYVLGGYGGSASQNDVQYAPVNPVGVIGPWTVTTSFTTARQWHTSVAYNGYLYVMGGYNGTYLNNVQFAPINADGTIGSWTSTATFTTPRAQHASAVCNGYLYVIGGYDGTSRLNDVQYAPINPNGTVGTWTATTSFTTPRSTHSSAVYNRYLYIIGGYGGAFLSDVQYAYIFDDGHLGAWFTTLSLSTARGYHTSVAYNGYLYVIGGFNGTMLNDVQYGPIAAAGSIPSWNAGTNLPAGRWAHTSVAYNGYLYVIGGSSSSPYLSDVQVTPINTNGSIGSWSATSSFTTGRYYLASAVHNGYLYILGGYNGTYLNDVQYAPINASGTVSAWTATVSFATARYGHTSAAYNGYLYVIGGNNGSHLNDVQFAPVNADGTVGSWTTTTSFTTAREWHTSAAYNGYLYVIGGFSGAYLSNIQYAPINTDGTLGSWTDTTSLPAGRAYHTSVAYNGYLYVIGGYGPTLLNDVQYAPVNADGTIGTWNATTSFTTPRENHTSVIYNGYLYVIGGYGTTSPFNDVQYAYINSNGTIGSWFAATSFPEPRWAHTSAAHNGFLYVIGGYGIAGTLNDVRFAPINSNGSVGSWNSTTSFQTSRYSHTSALYNGYLYVIGGNANPGYLNDVQFATLNGPAARARFSKLIDIGSDQVLGPISFSSTSYLKGVTNLTYAVAPSATAVFGTRTTIPNAASGTTYTTGLGACARYAWVSLDLDDTQNASINGAGLNGRKDILDFTITYDELKAQLQPYQGNKPVVDDSGNGIIEPNENVHLVGTLENAGTADAASVLGILSTTDPITIYLANAAYPDISAGAHQTCTTCYGVTAPLANRPATHWDFHVTEAITATWSCPPLSFQYTYHVGESFSDVPVTNLFYSYIEKILHSGVTAGCTATTYCPASLVVRQQMGKFICASMEAKSPGTCTISACTHIFSDVPASNLFCPYIEALYTQGVVSGCQASPLMYCPNNNTQRQAMAKFICLAMNKATPGSCTTAACAGLFTDVPSSNPFCTYIEGVYNAAVVNGCQASPLMYCPTNNISRDQMSKFLVNAFNFSL